VKRGVPILVVIACVCVMLFALLQFSSPVSSTDCTVYEGLRRDILLKANLVSHSRKTIDRVGVLVDAVGSNGSGGSLVEYDFETKLGPFASRLEAAGKEYAPGNWSRDAHFGRINYCWARSAAFDDGSVWSTSPL
jgi:hypothetical protein